MLVLAIGDLHIPYRAIDLPAKFKKLLTPGKLSQVLCLGNTTTSASTLSFLQSLSPDFQLVKGEYDPSSMNLPLSLIVTHGSLRIGFLNGFTVVPRGDPLSLLTLARQMNVDVLIWGNGGGVEAYTLEGKFFVNPGSATGAWCGEWEGEEEPEEEDKDKDELAENVEKLDVNDRKDAESADNKEEEGTKEVEEPEKKTKDSKVQEEELTKEDLPKKPTKTSPMSTIAHNSNGSPFENEDDETDSEDEYDSNDLYDTIPSFTLLDIQGTTITLYIYTLINREVKVDKVSYRKPQAVE